MSTKPGNILFILSDEHNRAITGCYGNQVVQTPHLDRLAGGGTRFTNAYCNSPICVPARAALATGLHVHDTGCWDNANPFHGQMDSWHHRLREAGYDMVSIGKLHFRSTDDDNGFSEERLPLHIVDGIGDLKGLLRDPLPPKADAQAMAAQVGAGDTGYGRYDHAIRDEACSYLAQAGASGQSQPFALFVSFIRPHFPLIGPPEFYQCYADRSVDELQLKVPISKIDHPVLQQMIEFFHYDRYFTDEKRAQALRAYYAMVSDLDASVGSLMSALRAAGLGETTTVVYASDHGDNLGSRGMWGKSVMYEDSVAVPLILSGPGVPAGRVNATPVSLIDIYPTMLDVAGMAAGGERPGTSLIDLARQDDPQRCVVSQYHAAGSPTGQFMARQGQWKYVHYVGHRPQLFDLSADPYEVNDLGGDPLHADQCARLEAKLRRVLDPDAVNARAFADQKAMIAAAGGRAAILSATDIPYTPAPQ
jgi:choline-sulfatase